MEGQTFKQLNDKRTERDLPQFRNTSSETGWMAWNYPFMGGIKGPWSTLQMQNGSCDEARTSIKKGN